MLFSRFPWWLDLNFFLIKRVEIPKEDSLKKLWRLIYRYIMYNLSTIEKKTSYRSLSNKTFHKRRNSRKGHYNLAHFWENCKKFKLKSLDQQKYFWTFLGKFSKIQGFFHFWILSTFLKRVYHPSIDRFLNTIERFNEKNRMIA